jgi:ABC-type lipoprotein export system ATPase subunit/ABC-type antimicrobial peptide transport system permease subunit
MKILELKNIEKNYKLANNENFHALKDINASFEKGELVSIIGESGSGKSILMNLIGGLDSDFTGELLVEGKNIGNFTEKELDDYRKNRIGFVFQSFNLISHLSILDNVTIAMTLSNVSKEKRIKRAKEILTEVGLKKHIDKKPNQLSGGQKQRVAIARALINDPEIIIADEPTGALDSETTAQVLDIIKGIAKKGKLVIMVTHSEKVAAHSSRVIEISDGRIINDRGGINLGNLNISKPKIRKSRQNLSMTSAIKLSLLNMKEKSTRNILVSLGASIGIMSVILMLSLGNGIKGYFSDTMNSYVNPLVVEVNMPNDETGNNKENGIPNKPPIMEFMGAKKPFKQEDIDKLSNIDNVTSVEKGFNLMSMGSNTLTYGYKESKLVIVSTISSNLTDSNVKEGSMPKENQILINESVAKDIGEDLIGKNVTVDITIDQKSYKKDFTISGIYSSADNSPTASMSTVYLNYKDLENLCLQNDYKLEPTTMYLVTNNKEYTNNIKTAIEELGYSGSSQEKMTSMFTKMIDVLTYSLAAVSGISLIVSAIMILVVLYISVVERTKEIGVLKAIGARRKDIRRIFVSESFLIGTFSGIIGLAISSLLMIIANTISNRLFGIDIIIINISYAIFGIGVSIIISMLAGLLPASKAAKLDPVESLRRD